MSFSLASSTMVISSTTSSATTSSTTSALHNFCGSSALDTTSLLYHHLEHEITRIVALEPEDSQKDSSGEFCQYYLMYKDLIVTVLLSLADSERNSPGDLCARSQQAVAFIKKHSNYANKYGLAKEKNYLESDVLFNFLLVNSSKISYDLNLKPYVSPVLGPKSQYHLYLGILKLLEIQFKTQLTDEEVSRLNNLKTVEDFDSEYEDLAKNKDAVTTYKNVIQTGKELLASLVSKYRDPHAKQIKIAQSEEYEVLKSCLYFILEQTSCEKFHEEFAFLTVEPRLQIVEEASVKKTIDKLLQNRKNDDEVVEIFDASSRDHNELINELFKSYLFPQPCHKPQLEEALEHPLNTILTRATKLTTRERMSVLVKIIKRINHCISLGHSIEENFVLYRELINTCIAKIKTLSEEKGVCLFQEEQGIFKSFFRATPSTPLHLEFLHQLLLLGLDPNKISRLKACESGNVYEDCIPILFLRNGLDYVFLSCRGINLTKSLVLLFKEILQFSSDPTRKKTFDYISSEEFASTTPRIAELSSKEFKENIKAVFEELKHNKASSV